MTTNDIIAALDIEIAQLQQVRALLAGAEAPPKRGPGRPKGSLNSSVGSRSAAPTAKKRFISASGRARIAAAQRARWAERKAPKAAAERITSSNIAVQPAGKGSSSPKKTAAKKDSSAKMTPAKAALPNRQSKKHPLKKQARTKASQVSSESLVNA